jgi:hypothetical protein
LTRALFGAISVDWSRPKKAALLFAGLAGEPCPFWGRFLILWLGSAKRRNLLAQRARRITAASAPLHLHSLPFAASARSRNAAGIQRRGDARQRRDAGRL